MRSDALAGFFVLSGIVSPPLRWRFANHCFEHALKRLQRGEPAIKGYGDDFIILMTWILQQRLGMLNPEMIDETGKVSKSKLVIDCISQVTLAEVNHLSEVAKF